MIEIICCFLLGDDLFMLILAPAALLYVCTQVKRLEDEAGLLNVAKGGNFSHF